jgi:hypothetical protein
MSTNFEVVKVQDDLAAAQTAELQARVFYRQAVAAYRVASGALLDEMGIAVKGEPEEPEPHTGLKDVGPFQFGHYLKDRSAAPAQKP